MTDRTEPDRDFVVTGVAIHARPGDVPAEAMAIVGGRVAAVGSLAEVRAAAPSLPVTTLSGGALLPAFTDAHQHGLLVALDPMTDVLHAAASDVTGLVRAIGQFLPEGRGWARVHGYEPLRLAERRSPTAAELDAVCSDRPLHVLSRTYHESVVNSAGLAALGVTRETPDPPGGRIVRDRRGEATGVLLESASFLAEERSRPPFERAEVESRLDAYAARLLANGIVRIGDAAVPADLADWYVTAMAERGVFVQPLLVGRRIDEPHLQAGATGKVLADGGEYCHLCMTGRQVAAVLAASTRAMLGRDGAVAKAVGARSGLPRREPGGRWHTGLRFPEEGRMREVLAAAAEAGSGLAVHAIGNGAVDALLAAYRSMRMMDGGLSVRIEHAMVLDQSMIDEIAAAGIPVVAQPTFLSAFGHDLEVVPVPRPLTLMPFRTMLDRGVDVVFSSDFPAAALSPWLGIADAVDRADGRGGTVNASEALTPAEAVRAYTERSAALMGTPDAGVLEVDSPADMQWVASDPFAGGDLRELTVKATWSGGRLVHGRT